MKFFDKLGKLLMQNMLYTVVLIIAFILFIYFAGGDLIGGILTAFSALVVYVCITLLYQEYKKMSAEKVSVQKKTPTKKSKKK